MARGMLRLWVVASILWTAFVWALLPPSNDVRQRESSHIGTYQPTSGHVQYGEQNKECIPDAQWGTFAATLNFLIDCPETAITINSAIPAPTPPSDLVFIAAVGGIPSLLLLALGALIAWVFAGFRQQPRSASRSQ
jgi:hypothetical protein